MRPIPPSRPGDARPTRAGQVRQGRRPPRQRRVLDRTEHAGILVHAGSTTQAVVRNRCRVSNLLVAEHRLARLMTTLERTRLLIIDDWGPEPLTADQRRDLWNRRRPIRDGLAAHHQSGSGEVDGMKSSGIPPSGMRSWTASFTARTASN